MIELFSWDTLYFWYIARATGILAFILFTIVVSLGLLMTSRALLKWKFLTMPQTLKLHNTLAILALVLVFIHAGALVFDEVMHLTVAEIFIPFLSNKNFQDISNLGVNVGFAIGLGTVAMYLAIVLVITSVLRGKIFSIKLWRLLHYTSFLAYITFVIHGYFAGSDSKYWWMKAIYIGSVILITSLVSLRIFGKKCFINSLSQGSSTPYK
jgi:methionine sulfoxide reductase heme-binding subunit